MKNVIQKPSAPRQRSLEDKQDDTIANLVGAWERYEAGELPHELDEALDDLTLAHAAADTGFRKRAREKEKKAIKRLVAAWTGQIPDDIEIEAALDALAITHASAMFPWVDPLDR